MIGIRFLAGLYRRRLTGLGPSIGAGRRRAVGVIWLSFGGGAGLVRGRPSGRPVSRPGPWRQRRNGWISCRSIADRFGTPDVSAGRRAWVWLGLGVVGRAALDLDRRERSRSSPFVRRVARSHRNRSCRRGRYEAGSFGFRLAIRLAVVGILFRAVAGAFARLVLIAGLAALTGLLLRVTVVSASNHSGCRTAGDFRSPALCCRAGSAAGSVGRPIRAAGLIFLRVIVGRIAGVGFAAGLVWSSLGFGAASPFLVIRRRLGFAGLTVRLGGPPSFHQRWSDHLSMVAWLLPGIGWILWLT